MRKPTFLPALTRLGACVAACGMALALVGSATSATALELGLPEGTGKSLTQPSYGSQDELNELRNPYANAIQGYSILVPGATFGINEQDGGASQTVFYLQDSVIETQETFGSLYTVFYAPDWNAASEIGDFFAQLATNVAAESGDSFTPINEGDYELITLGGVTMPSAAWYRLDEPTGLGRFEMRAMEVLPNGGTVIWSMSAVNEEIDVVLQGLSEAVATFKPDAMAYDGASVVWTNISSLASRPAGEFSDPSIYGGQSSGGTASTPAPAPTTASTPAPAPTTASSISYIPSVYSDGWSFTFVVPQGWSVSNYGGYGESALVDAYDPANPAVRLTYWGTQNVPGSEWSAQLLGIPIVMAGPTVSDFVNILDDISAYALQTGQGTMPGATRVSSVEIVSVEPVSDITDFYTQMGMGYMVSDESIVTARATMLDGNDTQVTASLYAIVIPVGYGDLATYTVLGIYGVWAPVDQFDAVSQALVDSGCGHFALTEAYIQAQQSTQINTGTTGNPYDEINDMIMDSYNYQQDVYDRTSQAWSDYIRGIDG